MAQSQPTWRDDFPILKTQMNGKRLAFLDTAASAQKPQAVIDAMRMVMESEYANIHRGLYRLSSDLTARYEDVRGKIARFIGAESEKSIVFTRNATESINLVAQSWGRTFLEPGDEVILSAMEHHANIVPWQMLRDQIGIVLKIIPLTHDGRLDLAAYQSLLSPHTRLVSVVHISNALGAINPVADIIAMAKKYNPHIKTLIDGSQAVVHSTVNIQALGCDFYVFTGHKLYGPTGIGVLAGKSALLNAMPPYQGGGDMIAQVSFDKTTYKEAPYKFEAGTPPIIEVIGLGTAVDYLVNKSVDLVIAQEHDLLVYATENLQEIKGLRIYGPAGNKAGIISFTIDGMHPSDIANILDQCGVAVRVGHHCCMPLMAALGIEGTVRISLGLYSNKDDIIQLMEGLRLAQRMLG